MILHYWVLLLIKSLLHLVKYFFLYLLYLYSVANLKKLPKTLSLMFGVKVCFFVKLNKRMNYQFSLKSNIILSFIGLFQHKLKKGKLDVISA